MPESMKKRKGSTAAGHRRHGTSGAVTSFGYRKDIDGQWIRKQDLPLPIPDERTPSPLPQRDASFTLMHEVLYELRGLRAFVGDRLDAIGCSF